MAKKPLPCPTLARLLLQLDDRTGSLTWRERPRWACKSEHEYKRWNRRYRGLPAFQVVNPDGYKAGCLSGKRIRAHQVVFALHYGRWANGPIDHINGDRADNRPSNLREVTFAQNAWNAKGRRNTSSRYCGVAKYPRGWVAYIQREGRREHLGVFRDEAEAALAYNAAAIRLFGPYAKLNEVQHVTNRNAVPRGADGAERA